MLFAPGCELRFLAMWKFLQIAKITTLKLQLDGQRGGYALVETLDLNKAVHSAGVCRPMVYAS